MDVAVLDMAGTTIVDEVKGVPFVLEAFSRAFHTVDIEFSMSDFNAVRGLDKREVFQSTLRERRGWDGAELLQGTDRLLAVFRENCMGLLEEVAPMPGAVEACRYLGQRGVFVALASGLPQEIAETMARATGLAEPGPADYVTTGERAGGGRPGPNIINDVLIRCGKLDSESYRGRPAPGFDYSCVLKVGDTAADVREGRGVGAVTVAVASGTQSPERLREEGPHAVLSSISDLPGYLEANFPPP